MVFFQDVVPRLSEKTFAYMMKELHAVDQMGFMEKVYRVAT